MLRCIVLVLLCVPAFAARWELVYFHDEEKSSLRIVALQFASSVRGVATGLLQRESKDPQPVALVTSDGGSNWALIETKEVGLSLYFLSETDGWMVTPGGIWFTQEAGRSWRRILKREGLSRVYFATRERGWAIGSRKTILHTKDGGKTWKDLPEAEAVTTNEDWTTFNAVDFGNAKTGVIVGRSRRPRARQDFPIWMDPQAKSRREWPSLAVMLQTINGGETWKETKLSIFGRVSEVSLAAGRGLMLVEFDDFFDFPSEVYSVNMSSGATELCFRRKDFAVTDLVVLEGGTAFLAGFEPAGLLARTPVPGRVRLAWSTDCVAWLEAEVDYRAVANHVAISAVDKDHAWAATDTGMILRLKP
jgi:hypothetical protein